MNYQADPAHFTKNAKTFSEVRAIQNGTFVRPMREPDFKFAARIYGGLVLPKSVSRFELARNIGARG